jgi:glycosyltransferase involved in cell wall biosynthesis
VIHLTSVHPWNDNRIFYKECVSLAQKGFDVFLIAPATEEKEVNGVHIIPLSEVRSRLLRILIQPIRLFFKGMQLEGDIYHFHDPELIPIALFLRLFRKNVIYDIHEDNISVIHARPYIPLFIRNILVIVVRIVEWLAQKSMHIFIAESYYKRRFNNGLLIKNYPLIHNKINLNENNNSDINTIIYTGNITPIRGALIHSSIPAYVPGVEVHMVGKHTSALREEMLNNTRHGRNNLLLIGTDEFVSPSIIQDYYLKHKWLAGLAIFPFSDHYKEKELTKFFEYMLNGIPIICSNFPVWNKLIEKEKCGLTVNPNDPQDIKEKIEYLLNNKDEAKLMGARGRAAVLSKYNWESQEKRLIRFYENILIKKYD